MICIKLCFSLVFLAIFVTVFADECSDSLNEDCEDDSLIQLVDAAFACFGGEKCDKDVKNAKDQSPACWTCMEDNVLGIKNDWCQCFLSYFKITKELIDDEVAMKECSTDLVNFVTARCTKATEYVLAKMADQPSA